MREDALKVPPDQLGQGSGCRCEVVADGAALAWHFADTIVAEFQEAKSRARSFIVFIVPVGPIGQFELFAQRCNEMQISLRDLVLINMDEYLTAEGDYIPTSEALSFRSHMERALWSRLDPALAPPPAHRHFPDPRDPQATNRLIERCGGVDVVTAAFLTVGAEREEVEALGVVLTRAAVQIRAAPRVGAQLLDRIEDVGDHGAQNAPHHVAD